MKKKKFAVTAAALAMAAVTVFSVGQNYVYADTSADIAAQAEVSSESVVLPVSVSSEAWIYSEGSREFGTWKALNIKVNDTMYPLSKNGAVSITFNNGDEIKIYAGDSYELWEGTISISGGEVKVKSQNNKYSGYTGTTRWGCNLVYSDGTLTFSKTKDRGTFGSAIFYVRTNVSYRCDLTAKEQDGTPIEGVSVVQDETPFDSYYTLSMYYFTGLMKAHIKWGNGNSLDVSDDTGSGFRFDSVCVTDKNGYTNMYVPKESISEDYKDRYEDIYVGGVAEASFDGASNARLTYIGNGLVDVTIDDESFTNTAALGLEPTFGAVKTDEILGDYYYAWKEPQISSGTVTLKDTAGNDIAVVTMGIKETAETHLIGGMEGESYKATGMEPTVDIKMADGVTDWTVSVTEDDNNNTLHINAVKKDSVSNTNGLQQSADGNWYYYTNNNIDYNYNGLASNEYGWWKITNGTVDFNYTGMAANEYGWWYVSNGTIDFGYTGMAVNEYGWWYMTNGALDFNYTGMAVNEYGWWYMTNGALDLNYTGMALNEYGWWYMTNGALDFNYTGMALNEYGWWYMTNGALDLNYTGMALNEYGWWYMTSGALDLNYNGLAVNEYGWWYMTNGTVDFTYNGLAENEYGVWNVVNGHVEV